MNDEKKTASTARENLEWLTYHAITSGCISMSRGRELLGLTYMDDMRDWMRVYAPNYTAVNADEGKGEKG